MTKFDVIGIGNPLMDLLVKVDHDKLLEMNLEKGTMHLLSEKEIKHMQDKIKDKEIVIAPGGSVANTLAGMALLGCNVCYIGKVGSDKHADIYEQKIIEHGIHSRIKRKDGITGKAFTFITPDTERTFAVHLGVACHLEKEDVFEEDIKKSKILHVTGYQLEDPKLRETALHAMDIAKKHNVRISIDLADFNLVKKNIKDLSDIVKRYADIVFANEEEAKAFTNEEPEKAAEKISDMADTVVIKLGRKGSLIRQDKKIIRIKPHIIDAVDATGAGDNYSAGFLYALTNGLDLKPAGNIASYIAAQVVKKIGARLDFISKEYIEKYLKVLK